MTTIIKCPFCKTPTEIQISDDSRLLINHLKSAHYDRTCIEEYSNLVMKVYENIQDLKSKIGPNHFEDCVKLEHDFETHQEIEFAISELESLLEPLD
jgi:hypothetical protein